MKLNRRQFISWGLAAGATVGVQGASYGFFQHVMRTTSKRDKPVPTVCRACPAGCGIVGYVREYVTGRKDFVAIMGNPEHPASRGKLCAQAMASLNFRNHPERLIAAQRRDGSQLSADEAIAEAGQKIKQFVTDGARVIIDTWDEQPALGRFLDALKGQGVLIGREHIYGHNRALVMETVWGNEVRPDFDKADLLMVFGANPLESGPRFIQDARRIMEARVDRGMRMIVFDPRLSNTGGKADIWVPLRPGTDHIAAFAIAKFALDLMPANASFSLRGGYASAKQLAELFNLFSLEEAGRICDINPELLAEAGRMYAEAKAPATMAGGGIFDQSDPFVYTAIALLDAIGGINQTPVMQRPRMVPVKMALSAAESENFYSWLESGENEKIVLISHRTNPVYERGIAVERALREGRLAYHVAISPFANETTALADMTIPEALPIESGGRVWLTTYVPSPTFVQQRPILDPPENIPTGKEIFRNLALAFAESLPEAEDDDLAHMRRQFGIVDYTEIGEGIFAADRDFNASIRYQVSFNELKEHAERLPLEPFRREMRILLHNSAVTSHDSAKAKWLAEINHRSPLFVNPKDARMLRVRDGEKVLVISRTDEETGQTAMAEVFVSEGVRPGCAAIVADQGHTGSGKVAAAERFKTEIDPDMQLIWWKDEGNGLNLEPMIRQMSNEDTDTVSAEPPRVKIKGA